MARKAGIITALGITIGAIGGYAYYYFVGCASGTCPITSKPLNAILYGSVMGGLLFNLFVPKAKE
jgi:C4-dicarboxylate transporter